MITLPTIFSLMMLPVICLLVTSTVVRFFEQKEGTDY